MKNRLRIVNGALISVGDESVEQILNEFEKLANLDESVPVVIIRRDAYELLLNESLYLSAA